MAQARRRVSYILPPPMEPVARLQFPPHGISRLGATGPLLLPCERDHEPIHEDIPRQPKQPRHRLGVASLALDCSTQLIGRSTPEGILYSGGRDGLVMSWDVGVSMKKRTPRDNAISSLKKGRWEVLTGWGDDTIEEETDDMDERLTRDGDVLGEVTTSLSKRRRAASLAADLPHEHQWQTDLSIFERGTPNRFRQCAQAHTDWVNDILLCNYNQTVVSASSDGTVKSWNPHALTPTDPSTIGTHNDYVRCLTHCRVQNWVASGSFDRTIKLWDLSRKNTDALVTLNPPDATAPKSSVYALAADPFGQMIASGSPERVVRLWDPRSGKRTGKLVGHTDNIRAILVSEDAKYVSQQSPTPKLSLIVTPKLLTGSADASIKLWSLASQRCLHTFTHHTESVWSLFSDHPSLEVFYSGDRSGLVCRVDVEDCPDLSEGECTLLCNDSTEQSRPSSEGINQIVVMDDNLLWTASGTSTIRRWNIPQRRSGRVAVPPILESDAEKSPRSNSPPPFRRRVPDISSEASSRPSTGQGPARSTSFAPSVHSLTSEHWRDRETETKLNGIPYDSLVKLVSPNDPFSSFTTSRTRDPEVATLYSAASVMSVPRQNARPPAPGFQPSTMTSPLYSSRTEETVIVSNTARANYEERELAADALPFCTEPDDIIPGDHGLVRSIILNDRVNALTVDTAGEVAVWDIVRGVCLGCYLPEDVAAASHCGSTTGGSGEKERSPREALEAVRERIEGEAVVSTWCMADTKGGVLTIHMTERCFEAEVYADEVGFVNDPHFNDESKLNIGKWVLKNLFIGFIREEMRLHPSKDGRSLSRSSSHDALGQKPQHQSSSPELRRKQHKSSTGNTTVICSPNMIPAILPNVPTDVRTSPLLTPMIPLHPQTRDTFSVLPSIPQSPAAAADATPIPGPHQRGRSGTIDGSTVTSPNTGKDDYFSVRKRQQSLQGGVPVSPDEISGWTGLNKTEPQTPSTPGGLMSRLKNFGKITKRPVSDTPNVASLTTPTAETPIIPEGTTPLIEVTKTPLQELLSEPLSPPSSADAPLHAFPPHATVLISVEAAPSYTTIYRGNVSNTHNDIEALEEAMPMWLVEYLLMNQIPASAPLAKISFVLVPWNKDPDVEPLPELLNTTQTKLTASRYLRVRKIVNHVQDKLERMSAGSRGGSRRASVEGQAGVASPRPRAEDVYEILCNDTLLPLEMTLAAVRQYVWKQGAELVLHYRCKFVSRTPS